MGKMNLLIIDNIHYENPPAVFKQKDYAYLAYAPNIHGEQMVFAVTKKGECLFYHGGFDYIPRKVINGVAKNIMMDEQEQLWLRSVYILAKWYIKAAKEGRIK